MRHLLNILIYMVFTFSRVSRISREVSPRIVLERIYHDLSLLRALAFEVYQLNILPHASLSINHFTFTIQMQSPHRRIQLPTPKVPPFLVLRHCPDNCTVQVRDG